MRAKLVGIVLVAALLAQLALAAGPARADGTHVVQRGETLYSIARRYGVTVDAIAQANNLRDPNYIWAGQRLIIPATTAPPSGGSTVHVVQRGETLTAIALRYGVAMWDIVAANNLSNPNYIWVGQRLIIPGAQPAPGPKPKPSASPSPKPPTPTPPPSRPAGKVWAARVLYNDNQAEPVVGVGSILQVSVEEKAGLPVKVSLGEFYETTMPTGSKPEVGPNACEFAPLQAGTWTITPEGLDTSFDIFLDGSGRAHVEFYRTQAEQPAPPPTPQPGQPTPKPQPPVEGKMKSPEYGMHAFLWWRPEVADRDLQLIQQAGFGWVKQTFAWREIEGAGKGKFDWNRADRVVNQAQRYGLRIIARVDSQPKWAGGGYPTNGPPNNMQDYADFLKAMAQRYKGRIHAYQVWNEPNLKREWGNQAPNPAAYTTMLKQAYSAIKSVDPNALVVTAGLAPTTRWDNAAMPDTEFVRGMYDAGAKGHFDALGAHGAGYRAPPEMDPGQVANDANFYNKGDPNCPGPRCRIYCFRHVEDLRQIMVNRGDGDRQIIVLEFGWTSDPRPGSPYHWYAVSEDQKADYLVRAYQYAKAHWSPWIGLMSLIYMPKVDWTQSDEQYWWGVIEPAYPDLQLLPAYVRLKNMPK